jgi:hypothetical protein
VIDFFQFTTDGSFGGILNIHGYYPGFNDRTGPGEAEAAAPQNPPTGEVDMFELTFLDLAPKLDKTFAVMAGDNSDYIRAFNTDTGEFSIASGPFDPATGLGVDPAFSTVLGINDGGGTVPLPGALAMGLMGGAGVLGNVVRRRCRRA